MQDLAYTIVAAEFNKPLIDEMVAVAQDECRLSGLAVARTIRVPGCYELPLVADVELGKPEIGGLVVLGYIERGETLHGEVMGHVVHRSLVELQLRTRKPVGLGIIGPGATQEQARARRINSAKAAVNALKHVADILQKEANAAATLDISAGAMIGLPPT